MNPAIRRLSIPLALAALLVASGAAAQPPADAPEEQPAVSPEFGEVLEVRVVNVEVFVTNRAGEPVTGLGKDDFVLRVDGEPMPISNFHAEVANLPTRASRDEAPLAPPGDSFRPLEAVLADPTERGHAVLLVDHTRMEPNNRKRTLKALEEALTLLGEDDMVAVVGIETGGQLVFYSDFLFDRGAVREILDEIAGLAGSTDIREIERRQIFNELMRGQSGGILARAPIEEQPLLARIRAYAAEQYEASRETLRLIEQVTNTLAGVPGRKALVYVGEGVPTRPGEGLYVAWRNRFGVAGDVGIGLPHYDPNTDYERSVGRFDVLDVVDRIARTANRAGVTLYAVDAEDSHGGDIRSALTEQGATSEAVSVIDANFRAPLEAATRATGGKLLRASGNLAEQLAETLTELGTFYSLGFTAPDDWDPGEEHDIEVRVPGGRRLVVRHREEVVLPDPDEREAGATVAALLYQTLHNPLGVRASLGESKAREDGALVQEVIVEIPVGRLSLLPGDGAHAGSLSLYVATRNAQGDPGRVQKVPFRLAIPEEKLEEALSDVAHYPLPVLLRPGDRQIAIGVRDELSGAFSALRLDVSEAAPAAPGS